MSTEPNNYVSGHPEREEMAKVLMLPKWRQASAAVIAEHFGWSRQKITRLRQRLKLTPIIICRKDGRQMRNGQLPSKIILSEREQLLIVEMVPYAERYAKRKANTILSQDELLSIAHDALIVAVYCWNPRRQSGTECNPGSKWRGYAGNGIKTAFARAFKKTRQRLQKTALFGNHPYQKWFVAKKLRDSEDTAIDIPDRPAPDTMMAKLQTLSPRDRLVLEMIAGINTGKAWSIPELAAFWQVTEAEAQVMVDKAKAAMLE